MTRLRAIALIWLIVVVGVLGPSIVGARVFLGTDLLEQFAPWASVPPDNVRVSNPLVGDTVDGPSRALFHDRISQGDIAPLWNGYTLGGRPLASVPSQGFYSPMNAPYWALPPWYAPVAAKVIELMAATGFMYLFLRRLDLTRSSSLIAGLIFAFSGFQVVWTNWPQAHIGALIPGVFWGVEYALQKRTLLSAAPLALVTAVMWLEGFPAVTVYALLFAGVYTLVRVFSVSEWRERARGLGLSLAGVLGGVSLAAFQLVPFAFFLRAIDTSSRGQNPNWHLARRTLATLGVPNAFGSPVDQYYGPADYLIYGPVNYVEIQVFIGIAALALIALGAVYGTRIVRRATHWYLWGAVGIAVALMYASSPLLRAFHTLPLIGMNHIGRMRAVLLFLLAALTGIGFEALVRRLPQSATTRTRVGLVTVLGIVLVVVGSALQRAGEMATEASREPYFERQIMIAGAITVVVLGLMAALHVRRGWWARAALGVIPLVIAAEIMMFAQPYWPQVPRDQYYPVTDTHRYLQENLGGDRVATADIALYPSTTTLYRIRSVTAHSFTPPEWGSALRAIDPEAFRFSATFTTLRSTPEIAASPMLDRMAATYFAVPPEAELFGSAEKSDVVAPSQLEPGSFIDIWLEGRGLLGAEIMLPEGHDPGEVPDTITTEILSSNGAVLTSGFRRVTRVVSPGPFQVAVPSDPDGRVLRIRNDGDTTFVLAPDSIALLIPSHDTRVAFAGGAVLYERGSALARIRWASESLTIHDPDERIAALVDGVAADTVILSAPTTAHSGGTASLEIVEDDAGDRIEVRVSAQGPGFLVIADSMQSGWVATVNGSRVEIIEADHIGVAIPIAEGNHVVVFEVSPPGWNLGLAVTFSSLAILISLLITNLLRYLPLTPAQRGRRAPTTIEGEQPSARSPSSFGERIKSAAGNLLHR